MERLGSSTVLLRRRGILGRATDLIRSESSETFDEALSHRFFQEMTLGTLDPSVFRTYLGIEFAFVDTAARVLGRAVESAPSFLERRHLATALHDLVFEQHDYFQAVAGRVGASLPGPETPVEPGARALHEHVLSTADSGDYLAVLASSLGAEWLYSTWCEAAARSPRDRDPAMQEWIELHVSPGFRGHVSWLREQLDAGLAGEGPGDVSFDRCRAAFEGTLAAEIPFHTAAYEAAAS
jgi:thiaminase (transcriptional activator TenA)